jgi:hypothetical protein
MIISEIGINNRHYCNCTATPATQGIGGSETATDDEVLDTLGQNQVFNHQKMQMNHDHLITES